MAVQSQPTPTLKNFYFEERNSLVLANELKTRIEQLLNSCDWDQQINILGAIERLNYCGREETLHHRKVIPIATVITLLDILHNPKLQFKEKLTLEVATIYRLFCEVVFKRVTVRKLPVYLDASAQILFKLKMIINGTHKYQVRTKYALKCSRIAWDIIVNSKGFAKKAFKANWKVVSTPLSSTQVLGPIEWIVKQGQALKKIDWYHDTRKIRFRAIAFANRVKMKSKENLLLEFFESLPKDWANEKHALFAVAEGLGWIIKHAQNLKIRKQALNGTPIEENKTKSEKKSSKTGKKETESTQKSKGVVVKKFPGLKDFVSQKFEYGQKKIKTKDVHWEVRCCAIQLLGQFHAEMKGEISTVCIEILRELMLTEEEGSYVYSLIDEIYSTSPKQKAWHLLDSRRQEVEKARQGNERRRKLNNDHVVEKNKALEQEKERITGTKKAIEDLDNKISNCTSATLQSTPEEGNEEQLKRDKSLQEEQLAALENHYDELSNVLASLKETQAALELQTRFLQSVCGIVVNETNTDPDLQE